ncbi:MAG: hypothetical protein ACXACG_06430 [Candidatus Thorarchaeota archaeon]|jgi:hypothetical protein
MTARTLFEILDSWTLIWDRPTIDLTLNELATPFYDRKVTFMLIDKLWDMLELIDDPLEFMTEERKRYQIEQVLREKRVEQVANFVQIEISGSSEPKISVLNADETIAQFPSWFEKYEPV